MTLTIRHSHAEGTLLDGTSRGDGTNLVLKEVRGWRWSRAIGFWYIPHSRDSRANTYLIERTKTALEAAGFAVEVEIDDEFRPTAEVEADKADRQEQRVDALQSKAVRKAADAVAADEAQERALQALPPFGEPIKVGHHSEGRHRRAVDRAWDTLGKSVEADRAAEEAQRRADSAATTTTVRNNPAVIRRRIDKLEADLRRSERTRDGHTHTYAIVGDVKYVDSFEPATGEHRKSVLRHIANLEDQIAYWKDKLAEAAANGAQLWDRSTVRIGDQISYWGGWETVVKVNQKSVKLAGRTYGTLPYDKIKAVRTSENKTVRIVDGERVIEEDL